MDTQAPTVGMVVKLKKGMLQLSARQVQYVKAVRKLEIGGKAGNVTLTAEEIEGEGGYWIKTDHTAGEWWAWILFRVA